MNESVTVFGMYVTQENDPKKYESPTHASASLRKLHNDRGLGVANEIGILGFKRSMIKKSKFKTGVSNISHLLLQVS